jgi:hypothetical protein
MNLTEEQKKGRKYSLELSLKHGKMKILNRICLKTRKKL